MSISIIRKTVIISAITAVLAWSAAALYERFMAERGSVSVEIAFSYAEAETAAASNNYKMDDFLDRLKAAGAGAVIIEEETPASLEAAQEAVFISAQDYARLRLLDVLTAGSVVKADTFIVNDAASAAYYGGMFKKRYFAEINAVSYGSRRFIYVKADGRSSLSSLPVGFSRRKWLTIEKCGFRAAPSPSPDGDASWLLELPREKISAVILEAGRGSFGFDVAFASKMAMMFPAVSYEFYPASAVAEWPPSAVVRGHSLSVAEKRTMTAVEEVARYERAARERGIRFFRVPLDDKKTIDANLDVIKALSRRLKKNGFTIGPPSSAAALLAARSQFAYPPLAPLRKAVAFCFALALPAALVMLARAYLLEVRPIAAFAFFNAAVLGGALFVSSFVSSADFLAGLNRPSGIRFLLAASWAAVFLVVFDASEARAIALKNVKIYHAVAALFLVAAAGVVLWRSGNNGFASSVELKLRDVLERLFVVRPRWKEIAAGQPFLWLAFRRRNRIFLALGALACVSATNTFLHTHTPLVVSVWRTLAGMLAGGAVGVAVDAAIGMAGIKIPPDLNALKIWKTK